MEHSKELVALVLAVQLRLEEHSKSYSKIEYLKTLYQCAHVRRDIAMLEATLLDVRQERAFLRSLGIVT